MGTAGPVEPAILHVPVVVSVAVDGLPGGGCDEGVLHAVGAPELHEVEAGAQGIAIGKMIVHAGEARILTDLARKQAEETRQQGIDGGALRGGGQRAGTGAASHPNLVDGVDDTGLDDGVGQRVVAPGEFGIEEVEQLVLDQAPPMLPPICVRRVGTNDGWRKGRALPSHRCGRTSSPCREAGCEPLRVTVLTTPPEARPYSAEKFEETTWNSCTASWEICDCDARAAGVLHIELFGGVVPVHQERIAVGHAAEGEQAVIAVVGDRRASAGRSYPRAGR